VSPAHAEQDDSVRDMLEHVCEIEERCAFDGMVVEL
jgi:hypothetical protein